jgi:hypothetical protein
MPDHVIIPKSKIRVQQKSQWCYAAIVQMLIEHYDKKLVPQSEIVSSVMATAASPTPKEKEDDNLPQDPYAYLDDLHHIRLIVKDQAPDSYIIRTEIDKGCPIIVRVGNAGSGHYMLIVGYSVTTPTASRIGGREDISLSRVWYIDPLSKTHTIETGSNANSKVECEYEDSITKKTNRGKDNITGYFLTCSREVCEPINKARQLKAAIAESRKAAIAESKKAASAAEEASTKKNSPPGKSKSKRGGRRTRARSRRNLGRRHGRTNRR